MIVNNLDTIVRRYLLERGLPIHWYAEALFHGASALRELSQDTLQIVNVANLPVNSYGAVDLPNDFVDDVMVGVAVADRIRPLSKRDSINPLRLHDATTGAFIQQTAPNNNALGTYWPYGAWFWFWNVDSWGQPTGRDFGGVGGDNFNGYVVLRERRQIQLTGNAASGSIVLQYISDGQQIDNATQIDTRAQQTINGYIDWKRSMNGAMKDSQARTYYNEKRRLKTLMSELTIADVKNTLRNNYLAAPKN